jgi:hypothetical protein
VADRRGACRGARARGPCAASSTRRPRPALGGLPLAPVGRAADRRAERRDPRRLVPSPRWTFALDGVSATSAPCVRALETTRTILALASAASAATVLLGLGYLLADAVCERSCRALLRPAPAAERGARRLERPRPRYGVCRSGSAPPDDSATSCQAAAAAKRRSTALRQGIHGMVLRRARAARPGARTRAGTPRHAGTPFVWRRLPPRRRRGSTGMSAAGPPAAHPTRDPENDPDRRQGAVV